MTDASERTRPGCSIAIVWAIMPPIDAPRTWAESTPSRSSSPIPSAAMSDSEYGASNGSPDTLAMTAASTSTSSSNQVDRPASRLS